MAKRKRLLIAEDDRLLLKLLKERFEREDCIVLTAANGQEALEILEKDSIDVMLTDLLMPVMTGLELLKKMKQRGIETPVIALTNFPKEFTRDELLALGAADYFVKADVTLDEIVEAACRACGAEH